MSKKTRSHLIKKFKRQRRIGEELPGLGKPGALAKRNYPPGFKGPLTNRRKTDYGTRLYEKQKVLLHYRMREKQIRNFVKLSKRGLVQNWLEQLFTNLESRLDNLIFRAGYAKSMAQARQLVRHGFVTVDGKKITIPSFVVSLGSELSVQADWFENTEFIKIKDKPVLDIPSFLEKKDDKKGFSVTLSNEPKLVDVPFPIEFRFIAEFYQKVKP